MKKLLTILFSLAATAAFAQFIAPGVQWQKSLNGSYTDILYDIQQTTDGGYIAAGSSESTVSFNTDYWVVKMNDTGAVQWQKRLGGTGSDEAFAIQQTQDGGYIIAGYTGSTDGDVTGNHGGRDYWIVKLNDTGAIQWQKALGGTKNEIANAIRQTADNGYIIAGESYSSDGNVTGHHASTGIYDSSDFWIVKLNDTGAIQWQESFGGTQSESAQSIQQTTDGGYVIAGYAQSVNGDVVGNHGANDYWLLKLDSAGVLQGQNTLGGTGDDQAYGVQQTADGGFIIAGTSSSNDGNVTNNHGGEDFWMVKLDGARMIQWQKALGGTNNESAYDVQQTKNGAYIVAGVAQTSTWTHTNTHSAWLVRLDSAGTLQWQDSLWNSGYEDARAIQQTTDGGFIMGGSTGVSGPHVGNYWIVKLATDPTAVSTPTAAESFSLFPNPATTEVHIQTSEAIRSVLLTDISGKEVFRGGNTTVIPTATLANGMYLVRVLTANGVTTQKLSVQR